MIPESAYARVALDLGCEIAAIKAVAEVESTGAGFLPDGRPKILFERHKFSDLTDGRFDASHPHLSNPRPGGYEGGAGEYGRLYRALQMDGEAAISAASWGLFQIMGFNWRACGEKSLYGFLLAAHHDETAHLNLFAGFVRTQGLADELRRRDWAGFARGYNGLSYARNKYHEKMAAAYARYARESAA